MNARFGYLYNGKFYVLYAGSLMQVDAWTKEHYKDREDAITKENLPQESILLIYCQDDRGNHLYNSGNHPLQSTVLYQKSPLKSLSNMLEKVKHDYLLFPEITDRLELRFFETKGVFFPGRISRLLKIIKEDPSSIERYYYVIKQASLAYQQEEKNCYHQIKEEQQKKELTITIKKGNLTIHGENIKEYLQECYDHQDYESFWEMASLDDLYINIPKVRKYPKQNK